MIKDGPPVGIEGTAQHEQPHPIKRILAADTIDQTALQPLRNKGYAIEYQPEITPERLLETISAYQGLMVRSRTKVTREVIEAGVHLEVIGRAGVGVENIAIDAATNRGIIVVNSPEGNIRSAAEMTIALLFASARHIAESDKDLREGVWKPVKYTGTEIRGKTIGLIGLGRVGSEVARMAQGLGMEVIAYDPYLNPKVAEKIGAALVPLDQLLGQSDFVSLHVKPTKETYHLMNKDRFAAMKPSAMFMNTSRGDIVDEEALIDALNKGIIAGAGLDVYETEPPKRQELIQHKKIVHSQHSGGQTKEAQRRVAVDVAQQFVEVFEGRLAHGAVNAPNISLEIIRELAPYSEVGRKIAAIAFGIAPSKSINAVDIEYFGELAKYDTRDTQFVEAAIMESLFGPASDERINIVNYKTVAKSRGVNIREVKDTSTENRSNILRVTIAHQQGETIVAGDFEGGKPRILEINGFEIELPLAEDTYLLVCENADAPGATGKVTSLLGSMGINISRMHLDRKTKARRALMAILLDNPLDNFQLQQIQNLTEIRSAQIVDLGTNSS